MLVPTGVTLLLPPLQLLLDSGGGGGNGLIDIGAAISEQDSAGIDVWLVC